MAVLSLDKFMRLVDRRVRQSAWIKIQAEGLTHENELFFCNFLDTQRQLSADVNGKLLIYLNKVLTHIQRSVKMGMAEEWFVHNEIIL